MRLGEEVASLSAYVEEELRELDEVAFDDVEEDPELDEAELDDPALLDGASSEDSSEEDSEDSRSVAVKAADRAISDSRSRSLLGSISPAQLTAN